jgi:hypothetical protein
VCPSAAYAEGIRETQSPPKRATVTATGFIASSLAVGNLSMHVPNMEVEPIFMSGQRGAF